MTRGEMKKVTLALYKIAIVEETINQVEVWDALGPNGIENVYHLQEAISELSRMISDDVDWSIKRRVKEEA